MSDSQLVVTKNKDGSELKLLVLNPTDRVLQDAQLVYNVKMAELIKKAATTNESLLLKSQLDEYLEKMGVWTKSDKIDLVAKQVELRSLEGLLKKGGMKLSEGRDIAIKMRKLRSEIMHLFHKRLQFESVTIEAQADQAKFIHILVNTVIREDNKERFFKSNQDYLNREKEDSAVDVARRVAMLFFGYENKDMERLPENEWLRQYKFTNNDFRLINKEGKLVDIDGRLIDDNGRYINDGGEFVDFNGQRVDDLGNLLVEDAKPYVDDETNIPVVMDEKSESVKV